MSKERGYWREVLNEHLLIRAPGAWAVDGKTVSVRVKLSGSPTPTFGPGATFYIDDPLRLAVDGKGERQRAPVTVEWDRNFLHNVLVSRTRTTLDSAA
jgi:hypothetical protein